MLFKETHKFKVSLVDNTYFFIEIKNDSEIEIEDLYILVKFQEELGDKRILPVLIYANHTSTTNSDLLKHMAKKTSLPYTKADAFVLTSMSQKILANLYVKINPPERPTQFFNKKEDALKWLEQFF